MKQARPQVTTSRTKLLHTFQNEHLLLLLKGIELRGLEGGREEGAGESTPPAHRLALFPHPHLLSQLLILLLQQPQLLLQGFELWAVVQQLRLGQRCAREGVMGVRVLPGVSVAVSAPATLLAGTVPVCAGAKAGHSPLRGFIGMIMLLLLHLFLFFLLTFLPPLFLLFFFLLVFLPFLLLLLIVIIRV